MLERTERAVGLGCITSAAGHDAHLDERHADERHDDAADERSDDAARIAQDAADEHFHKTAGYRCAKHDGQSANESRTDDGADEGETGALDAEQSATDAAEAVTLDESGHTRHHEGHADEIARVFDRKAEGTGDDEGRCDNGHEDGQQVLGRGEERFAQGRTVVEAVDEACGCLGVGGCFGLRLRALEGGRGSVICRSHLP